jgi:hypothetical protein
MAGHRGVVGGVCPTIIPAGSFKARANLPGIISGFMRLRTNPKSGKTEPRKKFKSQNADP